MAPSAAAIFDWTLAPVVNFQSRLPSLARSAYTLPSSLPANTVPEPSAIAVTMPPVSKPQSLVAVCREGVLRGVLARGAGLVGRPPPVACRGEFPRLSSQPAPASPAPATTASPIRTRRRATPRSMAPAGAPAVTRSAGMAGPATGAGPAGAVASTVGRGVGRCGSCPSTAAPAAAGWRAVADGTDGSGTGGSGTGGSGDMYDGVPTTIPVEVIAVFSSAREIPKSITRGPSRASSTFAGFRSRCTRPQE